MKNPSISSITHIASYFLTSKKIKSCRVSYSQVSYLVVRNSSSKNVSKFKVFCVSLMKYLEQLFKRNILVTTSEINFCLGEATQITSNI